MRSAFERWRLPLSRLAGGVLLILISTTASYWDGRHSLISSGMFFLGIFLATIAAMGRMWCSSYIAGYKDQKLITSGPYSLCRNPLYFFSMLGTVGVGFATRTFTFPLVLAVLFALYYPKVIRGEEERLSALFGEEFEQYKRRVPAFFPRFASFTEPARHTLSPAIYREHIYSAVWFVWAIGVLGIMEGVKHNVFGSLPFLY